MLIKNYYTFTEHNDNEGAIKLLNLLERAEHTGNVSSVVASQAALDILENKYSNF